MIFFNNISTIRNFLRMMQDDFDGFNKLIETYVKKMHTDFREAFSVQKNYPLD